MTTPTTSLPRPADSPTAGTLGLAHDALTDPTAANVLAARIRDRLLAYARKLTANDSAGRDYDPVTLINDAYYRVYLNPNARPADPADGTRWQSREQFWNEFIVTIRHLLVDHARAKLRDKRGGGRPHDPPAALDAHSVFDADPTLVLDMAAALDKLAGQDPLGHKVVGLHQYGEMSHAKVGRELGLTEWQARAKWDAARAFLRRELKSWRPAPRPVDTDNTNGTVAHE